MPASTLGPLLGLSMAEIERLVIEETIAHHGDPLAVLKSLMARYKPADMAELPRCCSVFV